MSEDQRLLREYEATTSQHALEELIRRHLPLVYSSALRQVKNSHLAEDVTQAVFLILTQKARTIRNGTALGGWLLAVTHSASVNAMKKQALHKKYELQAAKPESTQAAADQWEHIAPLLDAALTRLPDKDRDAIVLRFFQDRTFAQIGTELGLSEEAARKRVDRALERLRSRLHGTKHPLTAGALSAAIGTHAVQAAPTHLLAGSIAASIISPTPLCLSLAKGTLQMIAWTKAKLVGAIAASLLLGGAGVTIVTMVISQSITAGQATAALPTVAPTPATDAAPAGAAPSTPGAATLAGATPITLQATVILASPNFMDNFRIGWDILMPVVAAKAAADSPPPQIAASVSLIDNWTRNLILTASQADKKTETKIFQAITTPEGKYFELKSAEKDPRWTIGINPMINGRYVAMMVTPILHDPAHPASAIPPSIAKAPIAPSTPPTNESGTMISVPDGATLIIDGGIFSGSLSGSATAPDTTPQPRRMLILIRTNIGAPTETQPSAPTANK